MESPIYEFHWTFFVASLLRSKALEIGFAFPDIEESCHCVTALTCYPDGRRQGQGKKGKGTLKQMEANNRGRGKGARVEILGEACGQRPKAMERRPCSLANHEARRG